MKIPVRGEVSEPVVRALGAAAETGSGARRGSFLMTETKKYVTGERAASHPYRR